MERLKELLEKMKTEEGLTEEEQKEFDELIGKLEVKETEQESKIGNDDQKLIDQITKTVNEAVKKLSEPVKNKTVNINKGADVGEIKTESSPYELKMIKPADGKRVVHDFEHKSGKFSGLKQSEVVFAKRVIDAWNMSSKGEQIIVSNELEKAANMTSTGASTGDEWVPSDLDSMLWEEWIKSSRVAQLFNIMEMPTQPYDIPIKSSSMTFYKTSEDATITGSAVGTGYGRLDACKMAGKVIWTYELDEDSILAMASEIRADIAEAAAAAIDDSILNGDTTTGTSNINLSGGTISTADVVICFNGLRHAGLVDNTSMASDLGSLAIGDFGTLLGLLGKYNTRANRLALIWDPYVNAKIIGGGITELLTVDKYANRATIFTGEVGSIFNIPCIPSEELAKTNASGYVDNTSGSNTKGTIVMVHRPSWRGGYRRRLLIETDKDIETQEMKLVASMRFAFVGWGTMASQTHTAVGYDVTV
jgi:HK97 family phage major capsid protein